MFKSLMTSAPGTVALAVLLPLLCAINADAAIDGITVTGPVSLIAKKDHSLTADSGSQLIWGFAPGSGPRSGMVQYPGPTLIVNQGDTVTVNLTNELEVPVSIVFPGQTGVTATGDQTGLLTAEAAPGGGTASYSFIASHAGTYTYYSGTRPELQIEMGLVGAIIVRPTGFDSLHPRAYAHADTSYDREYLFLLSEMDPVIHDTIEFQGLAALDGTDSFSASFPVYWFINGRVGPDTVVEAESLLMPAQPYTSLVRMHPGERVLMRIIGGGRELHPFHTHGNHAHIIARNGRVLESTPGTGPDLATDVFSTLTIPGETVDGIFEWTGKDLGWDIYGTGPDLAHPCTSGSCPDTSPADGFHDGTGAPCSDDTTKEYCPDHGKPFPVTLPDVLQTDLGPYYGGTPFLGVSGFTNPDFTSFNLNAGYVFMWHSHTERELTNFDIFPGGMMTFVIIEPHTVTIEP